MDGADVETRKGGRRGKKRIAPKKGDSGDEFTIDNLGLKNEQFCNSDSDSSQQNDKPKIHQRLSREEKQYHRALGQAISESKSSPSLVSSSDKDGHEEANRSSQNTSHETEFESYSPDQTMDSDDDFLPSPKPKKSKKSVRNLTKTQVKANTIATKASAECVRPPRARSQIPAAACSTVKGKTDDMADTSQPGNEESCQSKYAPPVVRGHGNIRPGRTKGVPSIGVGVAPVIRLGLSRRAPVKHLHKQKLT